MAVGITGLGAAYAWIVWVTHYASLEDERLVVRHGPPHTVLDTAIKIDYEAIDRIETMPDGKEIRVVYRDPPDSVYGRVAAALLAFDLRLGKAHDA